MSVLDKITSGIKPSSMVHIGTVVETHLNPAGVPIFKVMDSSGAIYYPCAMMSQVAGADGRFSISAPRNGSTVVLLQNPSPTARNYFILGGLLHPLDSTALAVDGVDTAYDVDRVNGGESVAEKREDYFINQDYTGTHINDYHVQNLNNYINLSDVHGITLRGVPRISLEVEDNAEVNLVRIAAGGVAGNRVLNAHSFLNRLFKHIEDLQNKVDALEAAIGVINPALINALNSTAVLANTPAVNGSPLNPALSSTLLDQSSQVSQAAVDLSVVQQPQAARTVRRDCEKDKNPYILIP